MLIRSDISPRFENPGSDVGLAQYGHGAPSPAVTELLQVRCLGLSRGLVQSSESVQGQFLVRVDLSFYRHLSASLIYRTAQHLERLQGQRQCVVTDYLNPHP
jgi:hypothetical protein